MSTVLSEEVSITQRGRDSEKIQIGKKQVLLSKLYTSGRFQQKLVEDDPELALHWQRVWGHRGLGIKFAETYSGHPEHGGAAWHFAQTYKVPKINFPHSPVRSAALQSEGDKNFSNLCRADNYIKRKP